MTTSTAQATATTFRRIEIENPGETKEYSTPSREILAYLDYFDGDSTTARATVFDPYKGTRKTYSPRSVAKAEGIVARHITAAGYLNP